jgi:hypothetical protein
VPSRTSIREGSARVSTPTVRIFAAATLLLLMQDAAAQTWLPDSSTAPSPDAPLPPGAWPQLNEDTIQTWVGIRHNKLDGTVLGVGVRTAAYPSLLLELEVVPPGYGPAEAGQHTTPPPGPAQTSRLRTLHKLSLRYRF